MCRFCSYYSNWSIQYESGQKTTRLKIDNYYFGQDLIENCRYLTCKTCNHQNAGRRLESIVEEKNCIKSLCPIKINEDIPVPMVYAT